MVKRVSFWSPAMLLALSACGGGGGGGVASTAATSPSTADATVVAVPTSAAPVTPAASTATPAVTPAASAAAPAPCPTAINGVDYLLSTLEKPAYACTAPDASIQRFEVRSGDHGYSGDVASGNERSELVTADLTGAQRSRVYPLNTDVWISYSMMIEAGDDVTSAWTVLGQLHASPDSADVNMSPELAFVLAPGSGGDLRLVTRSDAAAISTANPTEITRWSGSIRRGQWVNVVLRVRQDYAGHGQLQFWLNGAQQTNLTDVPIGYNNVIPGAYWQYGIYRGPSAKTLVVRYANMEQGTASLMARVNTPLAVPGS